MSERPWGDNTKRWLVVGLETLGCGLALLVIWWLASFQQEYRSHLDSQAEQRQAIAIESCWTLPGGVSICKGSNQNAEAETQRAEEDLRAQQDMAEWAFVVAICAVLGLLVSLATALMLFFTLRYARDSANHANTSAISAAQSVVSANTALGETREQNERQFRSYVSVDPDGINSFKGMGAAVVGHVRVRNAGLIPARDVRITLAMDWHRDKERFIEHQIIVDENDVEVADGIGVIQPGSLVGYGAPDKNIVKTDGFIYVFGRVSYFDGFTLNRRFTEFCHRYPCVRFETIDGERQINVKYGRQHTSGNDAN